MKLLGLPLAWAALASAEQASPVGKVVQLMSDLQGKIIKEGEGAQKLYAEYSEWCEDRARELGHSIKTAQGEVQGLKAEISEEDAASASLSSKIEELASTIATDQADLKAAVAIRSAEEKDFSTEERELVETTSMLRRAVTILEREMSKGQSAFLQSSGAKSLAQALGTVVQAAGMSGADASKLTALIQNGASSDDSDADAEPGAPAAAVYESHSNNIVDTLSDLLVKAESQLDAARKKETEDIQNFEMMQQSLEDAIRFAEKEMGAAKKELAASGQNKAVAEGDLQTTSADLKADQDAKAELHQACMTRAEDFEAETKSRGEELTALAEAKKAIMEKTGAAEGLEYGGAASLVQLSSSADLANFEVVRRVRDLARKQGSQALAQLAQRLSFASGSGFDKVKTLITDMIKKLESEASADADRKAYCDKELAETNAKNEDKSAEIEKLSTKMDQMSSRSAKLKEEVAALEKELGELAKSQAEMDKLRQETHATFKSNKADLEEGLSGVKMALKILNEYYGGEAAHESAKGAGGGIIGLLEVVESDFSKSLAEVQSSEETSAADYDQETKENDIERTSKGKDVEHKTKESAFLDKEFAEHSSDRDGVQSELDAVLEYLAKIKQECTDVAESYASRKARREAEIAGLKEALEVLESETALVQRRSLRLRRRTAKVLSSA